MVSEQVRHKPNGTSTEDGKRLDIFYLKLEELYYPCSKNKGASQIRSYCEAELRLCFRMYAKCWFSHDMAHFIILFHALLDHAKNFASVNLMTKSLDSQLHMT